MMANGYDDFEDGFKTGVVVTIIGGLAVYGAVKLAQQIGKSPEQRLLENLGRDIDRIESGEDE